MTPHANRLLSFRTSRSDCKNIPHRINLYLTPQTLTFFDKPISDFFIAWGQRQAPHSRSVGEGAVSSAGVLEGAVEAGGVDAEGGIG